MRLLVVVVVVIAVVGELLLVLCGSFGSLPMESHRLRDDCRRRWDLFILWFVVDDDELMKGVTILWRLFHESDWKLGSAFALSCTISTSSTLAAV